MLALMPSVHLTSPGLRAHIESERLVITLPPDGETGGTERFIHLWDIERVFVGTRVSISLAALATFLRRDIPVIILEPRGDVLGFFEKPAPLRTVRRAQYRRADDAPFGLAVASALIEAKILNQRRVLQRLASNREDCDISTALLRLKRLAEDAVACSGVDALRGYEGAGAGLYFEVLASFFPASAPFERRSRRPPHNAANAILSYCYTLLAAECEAFLHALGLDPAIGCYHEPTENRPSLALDLIEPFRAPVADAMALDLLNHGTLQPHLHFETRDGGCFLNAEGRQRFFVAYERRMERDFTTLGSGRRTTLRQELERQARGYRETITTDTMLEPFRMN